MSEIQPPPKIERPQSGEYLTAVIPRLITDMERLAEWMYQTALWIERKIGEGGGAE